MTTKVPGIGPALVQRLKDIGATSFEELEMHTAESIAQVSASHVEYSSSNSCSSPSDINNLRFYSLCIVRLATKAPSLG